jgi:hypothetical protein
MLQTAVGGGCGSDPRFHSWGWVFTIGKEKPNKPAVNNVAQQVISISVETSNASNEVCGSVQQLFKTKKHHGEYHRIYLHIRYEYFHMKLFTGIIIQLIGIVQITRSTNAAKCQLLAPSINKSEKKYKSPAVYQVLCGSENGGTLVQTKPYQKFPFRLKLPEQTLLPPTLFSGLVQVEYKLVVKMIINGNFTTLGSTIISNNGQLPLCRMVGIKGESSIEKQIKVGGMVAVLEIPKKEFFLKEDISLAIKCMDPEQQNLIKLITVSLLKIITCEMKKEKMEEVQVLDSISFKRFLKRKEFQRVGKFKCGKNPRCATYLGSDSIKLKIAYAIEVKRE